MKRKVVLLLLGLVIVFALAACGGANDDANSTDDGGGQSSNNETGDTVAEEGAGVTTVIAEIDDNYSNALSPMGQLALGTLRLEDGDLAVTEEQAAELLPLWQALQSLGVDETVAQVELDAVVKQIENTMSPGQIAAILEMKLTEDSLTEMTQSGELGFRGFGGGNAAGEDGGGFPFPAGGFDGEPPAGGGPGGGFGGGPGGGFGGGPGGGFGDGAGGVGGGNFTEDDIATRRAQFAQGDLGDIGEQLLTGAVVRLMQEKTGQAPADSGGLFETVFGVISEEAGLTVEEIQVAMADGQSLTEIIEANDGDVKAVRAALVQAFEALPNAADFDAEELADQWLSR